MDAEKTTLTVGAEGQVTLGPTVMQHLGIKPGDPVTVDLGPPGSVTVRAAPHGGIEAAPPAASPNPFHAWLAQPPGTLSNDFEPAV